MKILLLAAFAALAGCTVDKPLHQAEQLCQDHRGLKGLFGWNSPHTEIVCEDGDIIVIEP